jgi:hypothetical protein
MTARPPERIFHTRDLPALSGATSRSLFVLTAPDVLSERDVKQLAAEDGVRLDAIRRQPRVRGVVVHPGGSIHRSTGLGLVFAEHVRALRGMTQAPVIALTAHAASVTAGRTRLMHFATVAVDDSHLQDVVLWEWATSDDATAWFGGALPDVSWLHHRTEDLLALRRLLRHPVTHPALAPLRDALADRYFSGRFVLEHHDLVAAALAHPHLHLDRERVS